MYAAKINSQNKIYFLKVHKDGAGYLLDDGTLIANILENEMVHIRSPFSREETEMTPMSDDYLTLFYYFTKSKDIPAAKKAFETLIDDINKSFEEKMNNYKNRKENIK